MKTMPLLKKDLEILMSTLPSVSLVEETEERLVERISYYQVFCFHLSHQSHGLKHFVFLLWFDFRVLDFEVNDLN